MAPYTTQVNLYFEKLCGILIFFCVAELAYLEYSINIYFLLMINLSMYAHANVYMSH